MSVKAYVLIEGAAGHVHKILEKLKAIPEIKTADAVTGQYDIIALIEGDDLNTLAKVSYSKIQMIEGVLRTITCNIIVL
ncbi:MAG: Lrp/AsnC ligand binding domain-containing protein [Deltaproteobacteria bacterium]|nr:Lrp/AsnC ligand binding domain-containing protein [Deltaproteobacteria bacterium]